MEPVTLDLSVGAIVGYRFGHHVKYGIIRCNRITIRAVGSRGKHFCIAANEIIAVRNGLQPWHLVQLTEKRFGLLQDGNTLEVHLFRKGYTRDMRVTSIDLAQIVNNHILPHRIDIVRAIPPTWTHEDINYSIGSTVRLFPSRKGRKPEDRIIHKNTVSLIVNDEVKQFNASDIVWWEKGWEIGGEVMLTNGEFGVIFSAPTIYLRLSCSNNSARRYMIEDIESN